MRKIYLAISEEDTKHISQAISSIAPGTKPVSLQTKIEVMEAIRSPFILCVANVELVDINALDTFELSGNLMILDPSGKTTINNQRVTISRAPKDIEMNIQFSSLGNLIYDRSGMAQSKEKLEPRSENSNQDVDKDPEQAENIQNNENRTEVVSVNEENNEHSIDNDTPLEENNTDMIKPTVEPRKEEDTDSLEPNSNKIKPIKNHSLTEKALGIGEAMDLVTFKNKKTVGLWAPLSAGVTTFLIDFALYLQQYDVPLAVVEVPKKNQHHLKILERLESKPDNWVSLIENFYTTSEPNHRSLWMYRGIRWFPLGINDLTFKRDKEFTNNFFFAVKRTKFVMVDLPTGEMDAATLDSLPHLDELWLFVDDDFDRQLDWKDFIFKTLIGKYQLPIKLIHSRSHPIKSRPKDVAEKFNLPLISVLPAMWDLVLANKHEKKPLIDNLIAFKKLEPSFHKLAKELIGEELEEKYKPNFWFKVKRKLLGSIDSN